ncbi:hypothetical protein BV25DRAFT_807582 [Artomyces pyxidatus]|uniref:Uncharacterized protein n=1 Tax=Artomyces pyxidatus TaxID=48021 RepID=A0ACB8SYH3_9AGAM|nr:hypothetical protein BV25DRAFT_807582 [Artomyces pyxidatus]
MTTKVHKNSLNITLTESAVFLRAVDFSGRRHAHDNAPPSMLRGLLTLSLAKPTRISSIEVELQGTAVTTWPEATGVRLTDVEETRKLFSASQVFFHAQSTPSSSRRTLSVGPGLSFYRDEFENAMVSGDHDHVADDPHPRGRDRVRRRLSADHTMFQRDPVLLHHSPRSPTPMYSPEYPPPPEESMVHPVIPSRENSSVRSPLSAHSSVSQFTPISRPPGSDYESRSLSQPPSRPSSRPNSRATSSTRVPFSGSSLRSPIDGELSRTVSSEEDRSGYTDTQPSSVMDSPVNQLSSPTHGRREPSADDHRGRRNARFSLASVSSNILDAVKERMRSSSPAVDKTLSSKDKDNGHGNILEQEKDTYPGLHTFARVGEVLGLDGEEHKEFGDGWREFKKGTYTFPISFSIPSNMPPTLQCEYGSVSWRLKASVHRPGAFTTKLMASRDVILVASPSEDDTEDTENIVVERFWDDQMQYLLSISGRMFSIGGTIPIDVSFLPMSKMKLYRLSVSLDERVDYYIHMKQTSCSDTTNRFSLLSLKYEDKYTPILPLDSDDPRAFEQSPLHDIINSHDDPSEVASSLMGPGPWSFHFDLQLPTECGLLHFTNKNKKGNIQINHTLRIVMRVERGDDLYIDPKTGKRKQFDIVVQTPVHILSCLSNSQRTSLPRYSESLDDAVPTISPCSCRIKRIPRHAMPSLPPAAPLLHPPQPIARAGSHLSNNSNESVPPVPEEDMDAVTSASMYATNLMYERLITGQQSEMGELPPAYEAIAGSPVR